MTATPQETTPQEAIRFQVDHKPDDHPDWDDDAYAWGWQRDFRDLGRKSIRFKAVNFLLSAFGNGDGSCIHPGNKALSYASGLHPISLNQTLRRLIEDDWIEVTHEATPTSPRVFALRHPERFL